MNETDIYQVQTEFFEGPLDLLLYLIRKNKMNILDIRISEITAEYLFYLKNCQGINPTLEGDFLMTASTLIYIKSRSLLPRPGSTDEASAEDKLIHTLIEYDKIQKISRLLQEMETHTLLLWKREEVSEHFEHKEFDIEEVSSFQLAEIFLNIVKKKDQEEYLYLESKNYPLDKKIEEILHLIETSEYLNFFEYVDKLDSIEEILVSFFALLEMVKQRLVVALQKRLFDSISVWKNQQTD
ncbi:MAG: segregation/condensation protein A [Candidatus Aminicenantes bacterium]|nr:segregation/condensation protein A [Candidatus Aminicenantes bacterium]